MYALIPAPPDAHTCMRRGTERSSRSSVGIRDLLDERHDARAASGRPSERGRSPIPCRRSGSAEQARSSRATLLTVALVVANDRGQHRASTIARAFASCWPSAEPDHGTRPRPCRPRRSRRPSSRPARATAGARSAYNAAMSVSKLHEFIPQSIDGRRSSVQPGPAPVEWILDPADVTHRDIVPATPRGRTGRVPTSFSRPAPRLPPTMARRGGPTFSMAARRRRGSSARTGLPVIDAPGPLPARERHGRPSHRIRTATRLTTPGTAFCSWTTVGSRAQRGRRSRTAPTRTHRRRPPRSVAVAAAAAGTHRPRRRSSTIACTERKTARGRERSLDPVEGPAARSRTRPPARRVASSPRARTHETDRLPGMAAPDQRVGDRECRSRRDLRSHLRSRRHGPSAPVTPVPGGRRSPAARPHHRPDQRRTAEGDERQRHARDRQHARRPRRD